VAHRLGLRIEVDKCGPTSINCFCAPTPLVDKTIDVPGRSPIRAAPSAFRSTWSKRPTSWCASGPCSGQVGDDDESSLSDFVEDEVAVAPGGHDPYQLERADPKVLATLAPARGAHLADAQGIGKLFAVTRVSEFGKSRPRRCATCVTTERWRNGFLGREPADPKGKFLVEQLVQRPNAVEVKETRSDTTWYSNCGLPKKDLGW
jgi:hypothetical protein